MYETIIEDYKKTIERLQEECTEKTSAILQLGEQLSSALQELCSLQNIPVEESIKEEQEVTVNHTTQLLQQLNSRIVSLEEDNALAERLIKEILGIFDLSCLDWKYDQNEIITELREKFKGG